jgi:plasmid stabilization system protein ParE
VRTVAYAPEANTDIDGIVRFISAENPYSAVRVAARIRDAIDKLAFMPTARAGRVDGTFEKVVTGLPYIIAFELVGDDELRILRIIHGARDWPRGGWPEE